MVIKGSCSFVPTRSIRLWPHVDPQHGRVKTKGRSNERNGRLETTAATNEVQESQRRAEESEGKEGSNERNGRVEMKGRCT